jgi:putative sterol carrier protein
MECSGIHLGEFKCCGDMIIAMKLIGVKEVFHEAMRTVIKKREGPSKSNKCILQ